jgi:membrane protein DedA with SNARE-associated domain
LATIYTVLVHSMVELTIEYVTGQLNGNKLIEDKLIKVMDGLRLYHQYVNRKQAFLHKKTMINNMREAVLNQTKETGRTL